MQGGYGYGVKTTPDLGPMSNACQIMSNGMSEISMEISRALCQTLVNSLVKRVKTAP